MGPRIVQHIFLVTAAALLGVAANQENQTTENSTRDDVTYPTLNGQLTTLSPGNPNCSVCDLEDLLRDVTSFIESLDGYLDPVPHVSRMCREGSTTACVVGSLLWNQKCSDETCDYAQALKEQIESTAAAVEDMVVRVDKNRVAVTGLSWRIERVEGIVDNPVYREDNPEGSPLVSLDNDQRTIQLDSYYADILEDPGFLDAATRFLIVTNNGSGTRRLLANSYYNGIPADQMSAGTLTPDEKIKVMEAAQNQLKILGGASAVVVLCILVITILLWLIPRQFRNSAKWARLKAAAISGVTGIQHIMSRPVNIVTDTHICLASVEEVQMLRSEPLALEIIVKYKGKQIARGTHGGQGVRLSRGDFYTCDVSVGMILPSTQHARDTLIDVLTGVEMYAPPPSLDSGSLLYTRGDDHITVMRSNYALDYVMTCLYSETARNHCELVPFQGLREEDWYMTSRSAPKKCYPLSIRLCSERTALATVLTPITNEIFGKNNKFRALLDECRPSGHPEHCGCSACFGLGALAYLNKSQPGDIANPKPPVGDFEMRPMHQSHDDTPSGSDVVLYGGDEDDKAGILKRLAKSKEIKEAIESGPMTVHYS